MVHCSSYLVEADAGHDPTIGKAIKRLGSFRVAFVFSLELILAGLTRNCGFSRSGTPLGPFARRERVDPHKFGDRLIQRQRQESGRNAQCRHDNASGSKFKGTSSQDLSRGLWGPCPDAADPERGCPQI